MIAFARQRTRICCLLVTLAVSFAMSACGGPDTLIAGDIAFVDVNVLPMDSEHVLEDQVVVIQDGRIIAIGSADDIGPEEGVEVIDGDDS